MTPHSCRVATQKEVVIARSLVQPLLAVTEGRVLPEDREVPKTLLASCEVCEVTSLDRQQRVGDVPVLIHALSVRKRFGLPIGVRCAG